MANPIIAFRQRGSEVHANASGYCLRIGLFCLRPLRHTLCQAAISVRSLVEDSGGLPRQSGEESMRSDGKKMGERPQPSLIKGYRLFRLFGFDIKLNLTWLLLGLLITWTLAAGLFPADYPGLGASTYWWMGVAGAIGILFSIVFHELSHSLVGRRFGVKVKGITLFIFGGVAEMKE